MSEQFNENIQNLNDDMLENVIGGTGEGAEAYNFANIAREMVIGDRGRNNRIEKVVGNYKIVVMTNFSYDSDFGTYMGSYSYTVYEGDTVVKTERVGDFIL